MKADLHVQIQSLNNEREDFDVLQQKAEYAGIDWVVLTDLDTWPLHLDTRHNQPIYGVEITTDLVGRDVKILAYFPQFSLDMAQFMEKQHRRSQARIAEIANLLEKAGHPSRSYSSHFLGSLIQDLAFDQNKTIQEVYPLFEYGGPFYVPPQDFPTTQLVIELVMQLSGKTVLSRPGQTHLSYDMVRELQRSGLSGLEVYSPFHDRNTIQNLKGFCKYQKLLITGGSDTWFYQMHLNRRSPVGIGYSYVQGEDLDRFLGALFN